MPTAACMYMLATAAIACECAQPHAGPTPPLPHLPKHKAVGVYVRCLRGTVALQHLRGQPARQRSRAEQGVRRDGAPASLVAERLG